MLKVLAQLLVIFTAFSVAAKDKNLIEELKEKPLTRLDLFLYEANQHVSQFNYKKIRIDTEIDPIKLINRNKYEIDFVKYFVEVQDNVFVFRSFVNINKDLTNILLTKENIKNLCKMALNINVNKTGSTHLYFDRIHPFYMHAGWSEVPNNSIFLTEIYAFDTIKGNRIDISYQCQYIGEEFQFKELIWSVE